MTQKNTSPAFKGQPKRRERLTPSKAATLPTTLPYTIDYKNVALLRRYIGITGKILPRRVNGLTAKQHRARSRAIRQARVAGRLPFVWLTESFSKASQKQTPFAKGVESSIHTL